MGTQPCDNLLLVGTPKEQNLAFQCISVGINNKRKTIKTTLILSSKKIRTLESQKEKKYNIITQKTKEKNIRIPNT